MKRVKGFWFPVDADKMREAMAEGWLVSAAWPVFCLLRSNAIEHGENIGVVKASVRTIQKGMPNKSVNYIQSGLAILLEHDWLRRLSVSDGWSETTWLIPDMRTMKSFARSTKNTPDPVPPQIQGCTATDTGPVPAEIQGCTATDTGPVPAEIQGVPPEIQGVPPEIQGPSITNARMRTTLQDDSSGRKTPPDAFAPDQSVQKPKKPKAADRPEVREVWDHFTSRTGSGAKFSVHAPQVAARLKTYTAAELKRGIDGAVDSPWWHETADREAKLHDPDVFFSSDKRVAKRLASASTGTPRPAPLTVVPAAKRPTTPCVCKVPASGYNPTLPANVCCVCRGWISKERLDACA